ncbi:MAG: epoxyqueuosine reductase [Candidatus Hydrogenedentota bacterium]
MSTPPRENNDRSQQIKQFAAALGFDACGIAAASAIDPDNFLGDWLDSNMHADMHWMARTKSLRQDIRKRLEGARSVVVVARNYYAKRPPPTRHTGLVSRYAWGRDYHRVLLKPLRRLARFIESLESAARCYCCIDSGPVMEKAWAARAGVGWIGKNSLVLRRDLGSWFFLGVVVTTLEIRPDSPVPDHCGACRLCIDACPTTAIVRPGVVDSRRCISYHTIENKGAIPEDLQRRFGSWVFGCDICQDVCPWNRKASVTTEKAFHPKEGHANIDLDRIAQMTHDEFLQEFAGTPLMRAKLPGMQRNVNMTRENLSRDDHTV